MSEEILKALMRLFAIIAKQDVGVDPNEIQFVSDFLSHQINEDKVKEYMKLFRQQAGIAVEKEESEEESEEEEEKGKKVKKPAVNELVKVLGLCRKINKTLNQKQKVVVIVRLFELLNTEKNFTNERMAIMNTVREVFNITKEDYKSIEDFVREDSIEILDNSNVLLVNNGNTPLKYCKHILSESLDGDLRILQMKNVDLYFLRYLGSQTLYLNGFAVNTKNIYLFANGSTIRFPKGKPLYYSDVVSRFMADETATHLSFHVNNLSFKFPNGALGLRNITFSETHGKLVGIMGASGAGKTTLLNVLCGTEVPSGGEVLINGVNLHQQKEKIEGVIGYIPQDDLLIEELTVFQNLYYSAKQCFKDKTETQIIELVNKTLKSLGLFERKDLKVGSPLNKMISGGQRKRLNIALELIREPSILFVDEPTSGLSSRDSENVMDLLRELTLKGKLIFVVIHQPSSEIYKMFDKMVILDTGGYLIYSGNPVEALMYFKRADAQVNADVGECPSCGNVNPELIFNIVESKEVDEFGNYTDKRKVSPANWEKNMQGKLTPDKTEIIQNDPPKSLNIPTWFKQLLIFLQRDLLSKISNTQYVVISLLEAPALAFILAFIIHYTDPNASSYAFSDNENIPPYIFMTIIVGLFLGLTVSAEEIFRDRKILKREKFLNLSRSSYLVAKVTVLFIISAIQSALYVIIGNSILGIRGMGVEYWYAMFATSAFANMLGLNISASFNSAVTIYILIPLLMIPQMALGGAMFSFDKLNQMLGNIGKVPVIAEFMASRWSYEALMVKQYKDNLFEQNFYEIEKKQSIADFNSTHRIDRLITAVGELQKASEQRAIVLKTGKDVPQNEINKINSLMSLLINELVKQQKSIPTIKCIALKTLTSSTHIDSTTIKVLNLYLNQLREYYGKMMTDATNEKDKLVEYWDSQEKGLYQRLRKKYHNTKLQEIVKKVYEINKIVEFKDRFYQQSDPIYLEPDNSRFFDFRTHFYAPSKYFMGKNFDTFYFNITMIWIFTFLLYITLYYEHLKKFLNYSASISISSKLKNNPLVSKLAIKFKPTMKLNGLLSRFKSIFKKKQ